MKHSLERVLYCSAHSGQQCCSTATSDTTCTVFSATSEVLCINKLVLNTSVSYFPIPISQYQHVNHVNLSGGKCTIIIQYSISSFYNVISFGKLWALIDVLYQIANNQLVPCWSWVCSWELQQYYIRLCCQCVRQNCCLYFWVSVSKVRKVVDYMCRRSLFWVEERSLGPIWASKNG